MPRLSANSCERGISQTNVEYAHERASARARAGQRPRENTYLGNRVLDDLLVRHITLVANQQLVDTLGGVAVDLLEPLLDVVKGVHVGHIVDDANAVGATVVRRSDGAEALLASRVPLQCHARQPREGREGLRADDLRSAASRSCRPAR